MEPEAYGFVTSIIATKRLVDGDLWPSMVADAILMSAIADAAQDGADASQFVQATVQMFQERAAEWLACVKTS